MNYSAMSRSAVKAVCYQHGLLRKVVSYKGSFVMKGARFERD